MTPSYKTAHCAKAWRHLRKDLPLSHPARFWPKAASTVLSLTALVRSPATALTEGSCPADDRAVGRTPAPLTAHPAQGLPRKNSRPNRGSRLRPRRARAGLGLVDGTLYGLIVVVLIVGFINMTISLLNKHYNNRLSTMISRSVSEIERAYSNSIVFPNGSLLATLAVSGAFNDGEIAQVGGSHVMVSPYDTDIAITGSGARTWSITIADLPDHACSNILTVYTDGSTNVQAIGINGATLSAPYTTSAIDAACNTPSNDVTLTF